MREREREREICDLYYLILGLVDLCLILSLVDV